MSTDSVAGYVGAGLGVCIQAVEDHGAAFRAAAALLSLLLCWRVWIFTISPRLHPQSPKQLPYWIPVLGHGAAFFRNSPLVLAKANKYFKGTREPYAVTLFGQTIYIITDPHHTTEVYKNTKNLTFEEFAMSLLKQTGTSQAGIDTVYSPLPKDKEGFPNPNGDPLSLLIRQVHMVQAYPGKDLDILDSHFIRWFDRNFQFPAVKETCGPFAVQTGENHVEVALWQFCSQVQVQAAGSSYFGEALGKIEPEFAAAFLEFDDLCWQILYQYPSLFTGKVMGQMKKIQRALKKYFQTPLDERPGSLWQIRTMEAEMRAIGVSDEDMATLFFNIFWGINTNSRKTAFWIVSYLLHNPSEIDVVREEISAAFEGDQLVDTEHLFEKCPRLNNVWHETLRMYSAAVSARVVNEDTVIGGKLLRKGHRIMMPLRVLHFDQGVWGASAGEFRPDRFDGKMEHLTKSLSWRPFGGGKSLCSGRYVAKHVAFIFTAMMLRRFDVSKVGRSPFPEGDTCKPVLGIMSIKDGQDYVVRISARRSDA